MLQVNFGLSNAPSLDAWFRFVSDEANIAGPLTETYATELGDIAVTVSSDNTILGFRTRATSVSGPCADLGPVIATELKANFTSGARLILSVAGLPSGEYRMITHHHGYHGVNPGSIRILIDDEDLLDEPFAQSYGTNPEQTAAATFPITAEQGQALEIVFEALPGAGATEPVLNGFQLTRLVND